MRKIVISTNATLDGVVQDPDGQEGFERGGWFHRFVGGKDLEEWVANETEEALEAEALLLGRKSFEWFASRTPSMGDRVSWRRPGAPHLRIRAGSPGKERPTTSAGGP